MNMLKKTNDDKDRSVQTNDDDSEKTTGESWTQEGRGPLSSMLGWCDQNQLEIKVLLRLSADCCR